uniref:RNA-dependent RNA polymerase n=1 Tax=Podosphaera prunicola partitivirus 4 TaxID=2052570 RepID=A0A2P9JAN7_9VIRU|nr:RNA-dependent RNA polymerase [Podosphaera prunicola partitivirus 4]
MSIHKLRSYLAERKERIKFEWQRFQASRDGTSPPPSLTDSDIRRHFENQRDRQLEFDAHRALEHEFDALKHTMHLQNDTKHENFEFTSTQGFTSFPENRSPAPGIIGVPKQFHSGQTVNVTEQLPETGFQVHPLIRQLLRNKYPLYEYYVDKYVRPLGTTDATFTDFNRQQVGTAPIPDFRKERILNHMFKRLNATPYLPLHFVDTQYAKLPLHTGTGYFNRHSFKTRAHAKYSHPPEYAQKQTSKGYFYNAFYETARTTIHRIKETGLPFTFEFRDDKTDDENFISLASALNAFFDSHATMLFTRNHISERDGILKQRPVYAVDDLFLLMEVMLTFPLLVMARKPESCIMYGLETIRGAMHYIDRLARQYDSFFTIDWSQYDQRIPRSITDIYYTDFLERLIVINGGYQPTYEYPTYPDLTDESTFIKMDNLLHFLHTWYNNMTFVTADGFGYRRTTAGVPSGLYNTQYLDSFGNLFLIIDGFIEYGYSDVQIDDILLFIMGDDNSGFTHIPIFELEKFLTWFETYAYSRYNMVLSKTKSVITDIRGKIEMLGYQANYGNPLRPIGKLIAQLCYPERGPKDKYMSYRAIGIVYASAGQDVEFYNFCKDIYHTFLPYAAPAEEIKLSQFHSYFPGYLRALDTPDEFFNIDHFPRLWEIRDIYSRYAGPLNYSPKWNEAHFINDPNVIPPSAVTMAEYRVTHQIPRRPVLNVTP